MRLPPVFRRLAPFAAIVLLLRADLRAQESGLGEPVQLPKYTVTGARELPPPESWLYARLPGFEVLSNASENKTKDLLKEFQRFAHAVNLVWPGMAPPPADPAALIICGRGDKFRAYLPAEAPGTERARTSLTLRLREQSAIVLDAQTKVLNFLTGEGIAAMATTVAADETGSAPGSEADPGVAVDAYRQLYREYIRFLLTGRETPSPVWFTEGLAQIFMAMEVTENSITLGKLEDPNQRPEPSATGRTAPREDRDFNAALARQALMPLPEMFAATGESGAALNPLGKTWAKQCYAFVHWGLYGDQGTHQKDFFIFLSRLEREPLGEPLFKECFKQGYHDMLLTLRSYIETTRHKVAGVKTEKGRKIPEPPPITVREATPAEIGRLSGETLLLAGQKTAGHTALIAPYIRGERDPALLAALGIGEAAGGDPDKAKRLLEAAAAAHVVRPRAYLELARLRLADGLARPQGRAGTLSVRQTANVLDPLFTAHGQPPPLPEVYEMISAAWSRCEATPSAANLAVLDEGVRRYPRHAALVYGDAALKAKAGQVAEAAALIRLGLRVTTEEGLRARFETLLASLPATPAKN